jgi:hypothetical protein
MTILLLWLIEPGVFQMPQLHKHFNVSCNHESSFMPNNICYFFFLFLISFPSFGQSKIKEEDTTIVKLNDGWTVSATGFSSDGFFGRHGYNGTLSSRKDSIELHFYVDEYRIKGDCSIERMTRIANYTINNPRLAEQVYDVPSTNRIYLDTINGRVAQIVVPNKIGSGRTMIFIIDCASNSCLYIRAENLNEEQQRQVLEMFQSINYIEKDATKT